MRYTVILTSLAAVCLGAPATSSNTSPTCKSISLEVKVSSDQTKAFPKDFDLSQLPADPADIPGMIDSVPYINTTASYTIQGIMCSPRFSVSKTWRLQLLAHGNTYTKDYWNGAGSKGQPEYSWVESATKNGYHTLALDLPCNGESTHAHPISECQLPLDAEAINAVIVQIRAGKLAPSGAMKPTPDTITYVGHSYGSLVGNALASYYPQAADGYVLSGFSGSLMNGGLGALLIPQYQPIDKTVPAYVRATNRAGVLQMFYDGSYDPSIADLDYDYRGTLALGEALTSSQGQVHVLGYRGAIFVLNGNEDEVMCQADPSGPFNGVKGNCSAGFSQNVRDLYPNARVFGYYNTPATGHSLNLHTSAQNSFQVAQSWISSNIRPL